MELDDLYAEYGKAVIQFEIIQGTINKIKKEIAEELNKAKESNGQN